MKHLLTAIVLISLVVSGCGKKEAEMTKDTAMEMKSDTMMAEPTVVKFTQIQGDFKEKDLTLKPGEYVFEMTNENSTNDCGFVLLPVMNGTDGEHIKEAYVEKVVKAGETTKSTGKVTLTTGTYAYFCPLNRTPRYSITVQ